MTPAQVAPAADVYSRPCPICLTSKFDVALELPSTPLGYAIQDDKSAARELPLYPLTLAVCSNCSHTFLPQVVDPKISYSDYHFASSRSPGLINAFDELASQLVWLCELKQDDLVMDIGSNDGSWLEAFRVRGMKVIGVEPSSRQAKVSVARGIPTENAYFSAELASKLMDEIPRPRLITANYVVANLPDLHDFFQAIRTMSGKDTLVSITTGYHPDQFSSNMIDFVYHEHLSYFTAQDFLMMASSYGFKILRVSRLWLKGGSIQFILCPSTSDRRPTDDIERLVNIEKWQAVNSYDWYQEIRSRVDAAIDSFRAFLAERAVSGELIGYGVSHSTTTLTYLLGLQDLLSRCVDDNPALWQKFAPGSGAQILPPNELHKDRGNPVVILAWQHDYLIVARLRESHWRGELITPLPRYQVNRVT